jgi:hypothetical protein
MVNNTDGNTYAINRHLEEREQHDMDQGMQDEIDTLHDEVDRLGDRITKIESQRDKLISALRHDIVTMETSAIAIRKPHLIRRAALSRAVIAECEADQ